MEVINDFFSELMVNPGTDWLEVPTIYFWPIFQAYVSEYPSKIWPYMVQYLHFRILEFPLNVGFNATPIPSNFVT